MTNEMKLHGGVITSSARHAYGVVELLAYRVRNRIGLTYYNHPYEIDPEELHYFVIVMTQEDLEGVLRRYRARHAPVPLIVHIDEPEVLAAIDYDALYPGVEIALVPQANLTNPDVTLKITLFKEIIEHLESRAGG